MSSMETVIAEESPQANCEPEQTHFHESPSPNTSRSIPALHSTSMILLQELRSSGISSTLPQASILPISDGAGDHKVDTTSPEEDRSYESEPVPQKKSEYRKKFKNRAQWGQQGKNVLPKGQGISKEMRVLSRKHALLEKNLKIDGLPEPPSKPRKRRLSLSLNIGRNHEKESATHKRKRLTSLDTRPKKDHMPKWELMGGDAHDPLNLNGLAHSEEGRLLNLKTPESSPLPTPDFRKIVYVKVPPNIEDPLNLEGKHDQRVIDKMLNSTVKKRHRSKKKKHEENIQQQQVATTSQNLSSLLQQPSTSAAALTLMPEPALPDPSHHLVPDSVVKEISESKSTDSASSPAKPTTHASQRSRSRSISTSPDRKFRRQLSGGRGRGSFNEPQKFPEKPMFTLGNYNRYYGYRNKDHVPDPRLHYFNPSWFKGKDVLDIGCNVGHITLAVAENFQPHKILGVDIDGKLIQAARQNIRHMLSMRRKDSSKYPIVFEMTRGPLEAHPLTGCSDNFPNNVLFLQGNYVPGSEEILNLQKEEHDTILALSITKWIHLNNGDDGLKLFFQKIFRQLRPGGRLILEPQPWSTYRKRAKLSPELFAKYQSIKLKPEGFKHYLLSIGFIKCEVIGVPVTKAKGFRRPLILFTKADNKQTPSIVENLDVRDVCQECGNTDKSLCHHPQFTGMRRGPYASRMYDHLSYPHTSSDSPYLPSSRTYSNFSYSLSIHNGEEGMYSSLDLENAVYYPSGLRSDASEYQDGDARWGNSRGAFTSSSGGSQSITDTSGSSSYQSYSSTTGGSSSLSYSSSQMNGTGSAWSGSSSYFSPDLNGDVASDLYNSGSAGLNGDIEHESLSESEELSSSDPIGAHNLLASTNNPFFESNSESVVSELNPFPSSVVSSDGPHDVPSPEVSRSLPEDSEIPGFDDTVSPVGEVTEAEIEFVGDLGEESNQLLVEPVHSSHSMNGDHSHSVVQHWDADNQDANLDAATARHLPHT